tara:strand:- start:106978 stop:109398 length:2421 start_codon:yes stop_codon:yes gene_type:complete
LFKPIPFLIFIFFLSAQLLSAQTFEVSGNVKNNENESIGFANVFLLRVTDSSVVSGSSSDEYGSFIIKDVVPDIYYLQASYVGKTSSIIPIEISKNINIGTIIIDEDIQALEEVIVSSKKPTIERKADRLVFNVENTTVSQGNSWDLLKRTPGVIVTQDKLQIKNKDATIYLNNRKIQLSADEVKNLLEGFSGTNIKSIEVIHNPPAEYEAEGGPILNIITSKNIIPGYKGSVNGNYTQAFYPKYSVGTSHYYKTDKLNLFANYSINPRKELKKDNSKVNFIDNSNTNFSIWDTKFERTTKSLAQNASLILDYDINDKNALNITSNLSFSPNKTYDNKLVTLMQNAQQELDSTLNTKSNLDNNYTNLAVDLTYKYKPSKEGSSLIFNTHVTKFNENQNQFVFSSYFLPNGNLNREYNFWTDNEQDIQIFTGQIDYSTPIGGFTFGSGAKVGKIQSESEMIFYNVVDDNQIINNELSDNFDYDETIWAGYLSAFKEWDKWSLKLGLRGEYTDVVGTSNALNITNNQNYFELFPTLYLMYTPSTNHSFSFDYSRKLIRPRYDDLNPFSYYLNENNFNTGNPNLMPAFSHNFNLNYTLKDTYFFDFYYRDNGNYISSLSFQDNQNQTVQQVSRNILNGTSYGLDINYGKSITDKWFLATYISIFSEEDTFIAEQSDNQKYINEIDGIYIYIANYFTLSKDETFTGDIGFTYFSGFIKGSYTLSESTNLTSGLRKSLWNKKAIISLVSEDILGLVNPTMKSKYLNQDYTYFVKEETQFIRLGFTYNFGNFKLKDNKREVDKNERDRLSNH